MLPLTRLISLFFVYRLLSRRLEQINAVVSARTPKDAYRVISDGLPEIVTECMDAANSSNYG